MIKGSANRHKAVTDRERKYSQGTCVYRWLVNRGDSYRCGLICTDNTGVFMCYFHCPFPPNYWKHFILSDSCV